MLKINEFKKFIPRYRLDAYDVSPCGKYCIYLMSTPNGSSLWKMTLLSGERDSTLLASFRKQKINLIVWPQNHDHLLCQADRHGEEVFQIHSLSVNGGKLNKITNNPKVRYELSPAGISPHGHVIACSRNELSSAVVDVCLIDFETGSEKQILSNENGTLIFPASFSHDANFLTIMSSSTFDSKIIVFDFKNNDISSDVSKHLNKGSSFPGPWCPTNKGFYLLSDHGREFFGLGFYNIIERRFSWVKTPDHDIEGVDLSKNGRYLAWIVNEDGFSKLFVQDLRNYKLLKLPSLPKGVIFNGRFASDGQHLFFLLEGTTFPTQLWSLDLNLCRYKILVGFNIKATQNKLVEPTVISYPSFDRHIPAYLFKPQEANTRTKVPILISIHGGPQSQERGAYAYLGLYQYLLSQGIGILAPNIRGSTGYGKTYEKLIQRDWGGGELKDVMAAVNHLSGLEWVDSKKLGIFGHSFGGFVALSAITRFPSYWIAAASLMGPSNLVTFSQQVPSAWKSLIKEWIGDAVADRDFLLERSPISYVHKICKPILLIQGEHDPRVSIHESEQFVQKIRSQGGEVKYHVFKNEGHGFSNFRNQVKAWKLVANYFENIFKRS